MDFKFDSAFNFIVLYAFFIVCTSIFLCRI